MKKTIETKKKIMKKKKKFTPKNDNKLKRMR